MYVSVSKQQTEAYPLEGQCSKAGNVKVRSRVEEEHTLRIRVKFQIITLFT
jgi:hypothetical protein